MKRLLILTKAMFLMHMRNRVTLFWNLLFPIFVLIIYRLVFADSIVSDYDYMTWVLPGILVFNLLSYGLIGSSAYMINMREKGVLRRLLASPLPTMQLMTSYLLVNVFICLLQSMLIILFSVVFFNVSITIPGLARALPMLIIGVFTCVALGGMISGLSPNAGVAMAAGQILNFSQMFISDLVIPIQFLPDWLQKAAAYLPGYAIVQLVRPTLTADLFSPELWLNLLVVAVYLCISGFIAVRFFRWSPTS